MGRPATTTQRAERAADEGGMPHLDTLGRDDAGYPRELERLTDPPSRLRVRGVLPPLARAVAIVGTRRPTERGLHVARSLALELAQAGCVVISGGAFGIDHAAHLGALDAGAPTIVVHASGLSATYPAEHRPLYDRIVARGGCELSEREDDATPRPATFLARNRLVAALSRAVVVVEAPPRSGALSTAAHARAVDVPVLVVPRVPEQEEARGSNDLLRSGALPCMAASDVLRVVEGTPWLPFQATERRARAERRRSPARGAQLATSADSEALSAQARQVLAAIEGGARELDEIVERVGGTVAEVLAIVADLELRGLVSQGARGAFEVVG
jgi:DNA processing protein